MVQSQIQRRKIGNDDAERLNEFLRRDVAENGDGLGFFRAILLCLIIYGSFAVVLGFLAVFSRIG